MADIQRERRRERQRSRREHARELTISNRRSQSTESSHLSQPGIYFIITILPTAKS